MARHKLVQGTCRLCGEVKGLSYEHIPPQVAFNHNTKFKIVDSSDYYKTGSFKETRGKIKQGGIGFNTLCGPCNNFLGSQYVEAYKHWAYGNSIVLENSPFNYFSYSLAKQYPFNLLKQVVSMFLSINSSDFSDTQPELVSFVKDPENTLLPEKYRVFSYLNTAGDTRYLNFAVTGNIKTGVIVGCSEITYPPCGFVLTIDFTGHLTYHYEITHFKNYNLNEEVEIKLQMHRLPTFSQFPLDYRPPV